MKYINSLLIIVLITFSYTNCFEFASLDEINELKASAFGRSLVETISLSLDQKGNVSEVEKLVRDMINKLDRDQADDTRRWTAEKARLEKKISDLTNEIERLKKEIFKAKAEKVKYEKLVAQAIKNLKQYREQRAANVRSLADNEVRRKQDHADYRKSEAEHADVINALTSVLRELSALVGSVSGKARPVHVRSGSEELRDAAWANQRNQKKDANKKKVGKAFLQVSKDEAEIQAFVELATEADQRALATLVGYIRKIRRSVVQSRENDRAHERNSLNAYNKLKALLNSDNQKLDKMITLEEKNLETYRSRVVELTNLIKKLEALLKSNEEQRAATIKEKELKQLAYNDRKAQRAEERSVMVKIQGIIQRRINNMSQYLQKNVD